MRDESLSRTRSAGNPSRIVRFVDAATAGFSRSGFRFDGRAIYFATS
jgi:hypothetical protein